MINFLTNLVNYFLDHSSEILTLSLEHIQLTVLSVFVAIIIGIPLGIFVNQYKVFKGPVLGLASLMQAIPSLALLGFLIPFLGIGEKPAIVMIVIYSLLPIIKNTITGLENINEDTLEAATGIGMTSSQILFKVQLPMALPVIMSGVRISAVSSVGLVTIAAFIGAGGLGYLVYAGIRTVNNYQILAGALPAGIIALTIDWIMGKIETLVTPISLQDDVNLSSEELKTYQNKRKRKLKLALVGLAAILVFISVGFFNQEDDKLIIGTKNFTEQEIIGNMFQVLIEDRTDFKVDLKKGLGSTATVLDSLKIGDLDISFDYTGTIYGNLMGKTDDLPPEEIYKVSREYLDNHYDLESLEPLGFNNTYAFATRKDIADKYNLEKISDLSKEDDKFTIGSTIEFMNRADGLPGVVSEYDINFKEVESIDDSPRYVALETGDVQLIDAFSTDALIKKYDLKILEDDKEFFPPYYGFPIIRKEVLEEYPEVGETLNLLKGKITDEEILEMNYLVDEKGYDPREVAIDYLKEVDLI